MSGISHGSIGSAAAINQAASRLRAGDIILLEMHRPGPRFNFATRADQRGYIAVEWWPDDFAAILNATSRGIIVVEAAGNGAENLDDVAVSDAGRGLSCRLAQFVPADEPRLGRHRRRAPARRLPARTAATTGPTVRASTSRTGARSSMRRAGAARSRRCGYGDLQGGTNEDLWYTDTFSGTSSASPIVTGAIACIQGMAKAKGRPVLTPAQVRNCLRSTGSPQQDAPGRPATQRIGNRPDLRAFATCAFGKGKELAKEVVKETGKEVVKEAVKETKEKERKEFVKEKEGKEIIKDEGHQGDQGKGRQGIQGRQGIEGEGQRQGHRGEQAGRRRRHHQATRRRGRRCRARSSGSRPSSRRCSELVHFIGAELRPDLSQSALQGQSQAAKDEKDLKDAEKLSEG